MKNGIMVPVVVAFGLLLSGLATAIIPHLVNL